MTPQQAVKLLRTLEYKPNWHFSFDLRFDCGNYSIHVHRIFKTTDADGSGKAIEIGSNWIISEVELANMLPTQLAKRAFDYIMRMEEHEAYEWFRMDGVQLQDPHSLNQP